MFGLKGRVAIVTGGNSGIGRGIAEGFASKGARVVIAARNQVKTAQVVQDIGQRFEVDMLGIQLDVSSEASIRSAVQKILNKFGRIDILVNNAGTNVRKQPQDYTEEEWNLILNTNLRGTFQF